MNYFRSVGYHDWAWGNLVCDCIYQFAIVFLLSPCTTYVYPISVSCNAIHANSVRSVEVRWCARFKLRVNSVCIAYRDGIFLRCFSTPLACVDLTKCSLLILFFFHTHKVRWSVPSKRRRQRYTNMAECAVVALVCL